MVDVGGVEWWSVADVAAYLGGIEDSTVRAYLARGQMPEATVFGGSPMWRRDVIEAWREPGRRR